MRRIFAALSLAGIAGCSDLSPTDELTATRGRWEAWGPASYDLTVWRSCECTAEMAGPVLVRVRNGVVESKTYVHTGAAADIADPGFPAVDGLFEMIANAIRDGEFGGAKYDPVTGHPTSIIFDYDGP